MTALVTVVEVVNRLDFDLDDAERGAVSEAIDDLSEEARYYGDPIGWDDPADVPGLVKTIVAKAVARWARNMNGHIVSRAGDEIVTWPEVEGEVGSASFSAREIKMIRTIGSGRTGPPAFGTISAVAYAPRVDADVYIRMNDGSKPMPFVNPSGW